MKHNFIKFNILFLFISLLFLSCPTQESSSSGGGSSSGDSDGKSSDDTEETSFKTTVDSINNVGLYTSIAVDGSNVYISYYDETNGYLKFAKSTDGGNTWDPGIIKTIDSAGDVGWDTSIMVDGLNIYISYYDGSNRDLKFAMSTDGGNTWDPSNIKTIDSAGDVGRYTSIVADGPNIHISYYDGSNRDLKFAMSTDGGNTWDPGNINTVDSTGDVGKYSSIAADGSNVYISYYDDTNGDLKFTRSTNGGKDWDPGNIKTIDSTWNVGFDTSIAADGLNIYISYYDYTNHRLKFAKSIDGGNTWDPGNIKTVDATGYAGWNTSIVANGSNIYISYYDQTNLDLKFARSTNGGKDWDPGNIKTVDSAGDVGKYTSIAADGLNVYISYYDYTNGDLKFAKSIDNGNTW